MILFFKIMLTMFIAEMGDKTQLLLVAMTSRFRVRDIVLGSGLAILLLNGLAVGVGGLISQVVPAYLIKLIAALAFFYFAASTLAGEEEEEEATAIEEAPTETTAPVVTGYFTLDGRLVDNPLRGNIYIQKMSNGTTRKVFFK